MKYRRIDAQHWSLDLGEHGAREALLRAARLAFETAPAVAGAAPDSTGEPDIAACIADDDSGLPRALRMFRVAGRHCETYIFRKGESWWFQGEIFARRGLKGVAPADRAVVDDPERFLADLATYLGIDTALEDLADRG